MNRRDAIRRGVLALGSGFALAGCTEAALEDAEGGPPFIEESTLAPEDVDLPVDRTHAIVEEGIEAAVTADIEDLETFDEFLSGQGLLVDELSEEDGIIEQPREEIGKEELEEDIGDEEDVAEEVAEEGDAEKRPVEATILTLEYTLDERIDKGIAHTIGIVAGGYASLVASDHDSELLEAHVLTSAGGPFGTYEVESEWTEGYNDGELTAAEYGDKVITTVETG